MGCSSFWNYYAFVFIDSNIKGKNYLLPCDIKGECILGTFSNFMLGALCFHLLTAYHGIHYSLKMFIKVFEIEWQIVFCLQLQGLIYVVLKSGKLQNLKHFSYVWCQLICWQNLTCTDIRLFIVLFKKILLCLNVVFCQRTINVYDC